MSEHDKHRARMAHRTGGPFGFIFFLGFIGAAIYFIHKTSGGFWEVVLGLLQAIVWPVYVMYHLLRVLGA